MGGDDDGNGQQQRLAGRNGIGKFRPPGDPWLVPGQLAAIRRIHFPNRRHFVNVESTAMPRVQCDSFPS